MSPMIVTAVMAAMLALSLAACVGNVPGLGSSSAASDSLSAQATRAASLAAQSQFISYQWRLGCTGDGGWRLASDNRLGAVRS